MSNNPRLLENKVAVITGGSTGIGRATAERFVAAGADVIITGRRRETLQLAVAEIGGTITDIVSDAADAASLRALAESIRESKGRIDVVFANAGILPTSTPLGEVTEAQFDEAFAINVKGVFFTVQTLLPLLSDGASIILNASAVTTKGYPATSVYSATKAAVRSLARTWTTGLKARRIRVNAISPGGVATDMMVGGKSTDELAQQAAWIANIVPVGRLGRTDEIAAAALFLASDASSYVTGIELFVDGGASQV